MTPIQQILDKSEREFENFYCRCIASDGEYSSKEMVEILSSVIKEQYEFNKNHLHQSQIELLEGVIEMIDEEGKKVDFGKLSTEEKQLLGEMFPNIKEHNWGSFVAYQNIKGILESNIKER